MVSGLVLAVVAGWCRLDCQFGASVGIGCTLFGLATVVLGVAAVVVRLLCLLVVFAGVAAG